MPSQTSVTRNLWRNWMEGGETMVKQIIMLLLAFAIAVIASKL